MIKKLSKEAEDQLMKALPQISDLAQEGEDPNEAIAKVASEQKIPANYIHLLVNAYNTGRTTIQRQTGSDVWEKAAEFPIADTQLILEKMFPSKVKSAAQLVNETQISEHYSSSPSRWIARRDREEKSAAAKIYKFDDYKKPDPYPRDEQNLYKQAQVKIHKLAKDIEEARYKTNYALETALDLKQGLVNYFKSASHKPFQEVKSNCISMYGDIAQHLFEQIEEENPQFSKQASTKSIAPAIGQPYNLVKECVDVTTIYRELRDHYNEKTASFDSTKQELLSPFGKAPKINPVLGVLEPVSASYIRTGLSKEADENGETNKKPKGVVEKATGSPLFGKTLFKSPIKEDKKQLGSGLTGNLTGSLYKQVQPNFAPTLESMLGQKADSTKFQKDLSEHESMIDSINQEARLSELLATDDVLSQADPHEVLRSYSSLRSLAPEAMANPEVMRTLLRQHVQQGGSGSIFDLDTVTKLEQNLKKSRGMGSSSSKEEDK
jgi:hypothetical protein